MRDDFLATVTKSLAARAGYVCSNPQCLAPTSGPSSTNTKAVNLGVGAHITAASPGGSRYNQLLTPDQRAGIDNGIWLCRICGTLIDADPLRFPVEMLERWKSDAERRAANAVGRPASAPTQDVAPADAELFAMLLVSLPFEGSIGFIDEFNMAGFSFESDRLSELDRFVHDWADAMHEFIDPELEQLRAHLYSLARSYLGFLYRHTFCTDGGMRTVPPEWEVEQRDRFIEVVETLHTLAGAIVKAHQKLVRVGRRRINGQTA